MPVVTKKDVIHNPDGDNERLNQIHARLRDPNGHNMLMERNLIVQNRHKSVDNSREFESIFRNSP